MTMKLRNTDDATLIFEQLCENDNLNPDLIRSARRSAHLMEARTEIAKIMREVGYTYAAIGHAMNKDHSSIMYLTNIKRRENAKKRMMGYYNEKVKCAHESRLHINTHPN